MFLWCGAVGDTHEKRCNVKTIRDNRVMSSRVDERNEIEFSHRAKIRDARKMRTSLINRMSRSNEIDWINDTLLGSISMPRVM